MRVLMASRNARILTLQVLIAGSVIRADPSYQAIQSEYIALTAVKKVPQLPRRRLLEVLHSSRALDTFLRVFTQMHGCKVTAPSLGGYLKSLESHANPKLSFLAPALVKQYQGRI